jgi:hypothetical protein
MAYDEGLAERGRVSRASLAFALLCGCGGSTVPFDAGAVDAATSFCTGTALDGTCAQAFLAPLADCLQAAGACTASSSTTACWPSGGEVTLTTSSSGGGTNTQLAASRNGLSCFITTVTGSSASPYVITSTTGDALTYYPSSGKVLCPDNRELTLDTPYGGCDALRLVLAGPDFSSCGAGTCP